MREWCLSRLAWYEEDPVVAAALLEASCASNNSTWLAEAARLAHITGSTATRDYYMTRLHDADQEFADVLARELGLGAAD